MPWTPPGKETTVGAVGGVDPERCAEAVGKGTAVQDIPVDRSPFLAPAVRPTLDAGSAP